MNENFQDNLNEFEQFFIEEPNAEDKAMEVLSDFYHYLLTWMENNNITKAELARILGKSRASITKMLRHSPNISINKIIEITHPLGLDVKLGIEQIPESLGKQNLKCVTKYVVIQVDTQQEQWHTPQQQDFPSDVQYLTSNKILFNFEGINGRA